MELTIAIGAAQFRLATSQVRSLPYIQSRPLILLEDGTEVRLVDSGEARYLLIDHRGDQNGPAHLEFWECTGRPELGLDGLWAICDAAPAARG